MKCPRIAWDAGLKQTTVRRLATLLLLSCCSMVSAGRKQEPTEAEMRATKIGVTGMQASIAATFWVNASCDCRLIGLDDKQACADNKGSLPDEQTAAMTAGLAVKGRRDYFNDCYPPSSRHLGSHSLIALGWRGNDAPNPHSGRGPKNHRRQCGRQNQGSSRCARSGLIRSADPRQRPCGRFHQVGRDLSGSFTRSRGSFHRPSARLVSRTPAPPSAPIPSAARP